jgi:hypothetical protein
VTKVILVGIGTQNSGHGRDIETEEATTNGREGANRVDVVEGLFQLVMMLL